MGSAGDSTENIILDSILGDQHSVLIANTVYVTLFTAAPNDSGGGTEVSNVGSGFARVALANTSTNWPNAVNGAKWNGVIVQFPISISDWGTVTHWGIFDDATAGTLLLWGALDRNLTIVSGNAPYFSPGDLTVYAD